MRELFITVIIVLKQIFLLRLVSILSHGDLATVIHVIERHRYKKLCLILRFWLLLWHYVLPFTHAFDLSALLIKQLDLFFGPLQECLEQYLLVNLFFDGHIKLFLCISDVSHFFTSHWFAELRKVLPPVTNVPAIIVAYPGHSLHAWFSRVAWILEDCVFMHLNRCPDWNRLFWDLHGIAFVLIIIEEVSVLAGVQFIGDKGQKSVIELELRAHLVP